MDGTLIDADGSDAATPDSGVAYAFQGLRTTIDLPINDNTNGTDTITWTSDGTGSFARIHYASSGTISLYWNYPDESVTTGYVKIESRFGMAGAVAKHVKVFGAGYPATYSNCTWSANPGAIAEILYSDATGGGDISTETTFLGNLTGGGAYSQVPHPSFDVTSNTVNDTQWHTWEYAWRFDTSGSGYFSSRRDGVVVLKMHGVINAGSGLAGRHQISFGDFSSTAGWNLDFRNCDIATSIPSWM